MALHFESPTAPTPMRTNITRLPCRSADPDWWFAEHPHVLRRAQNLCQSCPAITNCLAGALERREPHGVWGGEIVVNGAVVAAKRSRGRPRKVSVA